MRESDETNFCWITDFFFTVFVDNIKAMVPESQISQRAGDASKELKFSLGVSVLQSKLVSELNNSEEKQQVC